DGVELVSGMSGLRYFRRRDHFIRSHKNHPTLADLSPADARQTDDFLFWFEAKKLRERFLDVLAPNDMHAGFHQQFDGECTFPRQPLGGRRKRCLVPIAFSNE